MDVAEPRSRVSDLHRRAIPRGLSSLRGRSVMKPRSKRVKFVKRKREGESLNRIFIQPIRVTRVMYIYVCVCAYVCVCGTRSLMCLGESASIFRKRSLKYVIQFFFPSFIVFCDTS